MNTETECIVALLHDVVEDTDITFRQLEKEFSSEIIEILKLLTHSSNIELCIISAIFTFLAIGFFLISVI